MTIETYKAIAQEVADKYLQAGGELPKIAAVVIKERDIIPQRNELNRIAEYINNAVQVALFKGGNRLDTFPIVTPDAISAYTHTSESILPVQNHLPETNNQVTVPVTTTEYERKMNESAKKVRRTEEIQRRIAANKIEQARARHQIEEIFGHRERLDREIVALIASLAGDISHVQNPGYGSRMIRIIRLQVPAPFADIIMQHIGEGPLAKFASYEDDGKVYKVNPEHKFMKKVAKLKKTIEDREYTDRKLKLYLAAAKAGEE